MLPQDGAVPHGQLQYEPEHMSQLIIEEHELRIQHLYVTNCDLLRVFQRRRVNTVLI